MDITLIPMTIHRPSESDFEVFQTEEDIEQQSDEWFVAALAGLFMVLGIVPPVQQATKSNGLH